MMRLHDYLPSQNAWKVRQMLQLLGTGYETVPVSIFEGEGRTAAYRARNPMGAVPVLELGDGRCLPESNAILCYLAEGTPWLPDDRWQRAQVLRWLFFEADQVQAGIATLRYRTLTDKRDDAATIARLRKRSLRTLDVLERWFTDHDFLVDSFSIADISLFAYVGLAAQAKLPMSDYPQVCAWIARVRAQPGFLDEMYGYDIDPHSAHDFA